MRQALQNARGNRSIGDGDVSDVPNADVASFTGLGRRPRTIGRPLTCVVTMQFTVCFLGCRRTPRPSYSAGVDLTA